MRGNTARLLVLVLGLLVLALGFGALLSTGFSGPRVVEEIERSFRLEPGRTLYVQGENGQIFFENWDGSEVVVHATKSSPQVLGSIARWFARQVTVEITEDGSGVRAVQRGHSGFFGQVHVTYRILVPRDWSGKVTLRTSNGSILAEGIRGEADLHTSNGRISIEGQSGTLKARTSNGRVELAGVDGVVEAETSNGAIRVDGGRLKGAGRFRTSNGEVHFFAKLEQGASYTVRTSNGDVTLVLAEPDVAIDLATTNGSINLRADVTASRLGRNELAGRIGNGSARLEVRTSNGSITLSSSGASAI